MFLSIIDMDKDLANSNFCWMKIHLSSNLIHPKYLVVS